MNRTKNTPKNRKMIAYVGIAAALLLIPTAQAIKLVPQDLDVNVDSLGGGGDIFGTLYCDSRVGCDSTRSVASGCSGDGYWEVDAEVVGGDLAYAAYPYVKCNGDDIVGCSIPAASKACASDLKKGVKGGLECDVTLDAYDVDVNVDVKCKDPPMPGQTGVLVEKHISFVAETASKVVEYTVVTILPALPE